MDTCPETDPQHPLTATRIHSRAGQRVPAKVTAGPQPHTTGLDETFAPDGKGKEHAAAKAEPVRAGPVWATVTVTDKKMDQNPEVECNDCGKKFYGGANRISRHIMEKCKCSTPALQKLKAKHVVPLGPKVVG